MRLGIPLERALHERRPLGDIFDESAAEIVEDDDVVGAYGHHFLGNVGPVVEPPGDARTDHEILQDLARRVGLAEEMAKAALFLASEEASFITGSEFVVDGGITAAYVTPEGE